MTVITTTNTVAPMTESRARELVNIVNESLNEARAALLELWLNDGWTVLGYESWEECVRNEFIDRHRSYLYRMLATARVEAEAGLPVGSRPEFHVREINTILDDDHLRVIALQTAEEEGAETANECKAIAKRVWLDNTTDVAPSPHAATVYQRYREGELAAPEAFDLIHLLSLTEDAENKARAIVSNCSNVALAQRVISASRMGHDDVIDEIYHSGTIPAFPDPIPLAEATSSTLEAWLEVDSAERRAQHVVDNQSYYDEFRNLSGAVINIARRMARNFVNDGVMLGLTEMVELNNALFELDRLQETGG